MADCRGFGPGFLELISQSGVESGLRMAVFCPLAILQELRALQVLSPFYEEGLGVAGKLRELADQVDETSRRLVSEQLILGAPRPGHR